jgi:Cu2+-exporting ATPase/Cu+-exporting ATPase
MRAVSDAAMVGDGINDAGAMSRAKVSVVVGGAMDRALQVADVFLTQDGLSQLPAIWKVKDQAENGLKRIRYFSLVYNFTTAVLAIGGVVHPLLAAILMPISSISVLLISVMSVKGEKWTS